MIRHKFPRSSFRPRPFWLFFVLGLLLVGLLALPLLALVLRAVGRDFFDYAFMPAAVAALRLSLLTSLTSVAISVLTGTPLAYGLARWKFRGRGALELLIDLPVVLPPSVAGLGLLITFGRQGLVGKYLTPLGISIPFTSLAVILAQTFVSAPFFIRSARTGIAGVDRDIEDAARADGASERQLFRSVTVPLAGAALAAGLTMSWARSLGEFGATIMFAGNIERRTQTLPLVVYSEFQGGDLDASIAAAAILVLAAFGVLVAVRVFHWGRVADVRGIG